MKVRRRKRMRFLLLAAAFLAISMQLPVQADEIQYVKSPEITAGSASGEDAKVTWTCLWFGSYPQDEVQPGSGLYKKLEKEKGWSQAGDRQVNGVRYRRLQKSDVLLQASTGGYFDWGKKYKWHYFIYAPIKWRILSAGDGRALLLSDRILDCQVMNVQTDSRQKGEPVLWDSATLRSWLNGYGASANSAGISYEKDNFRSTAFTKAQMALIAGTDRYSETVHPDADGTGSFQESGRVTDSIFAPALSEISGSGGAKYGFSVSADETGSVSTGAEASVTDYARAKGAWAFSAEEGRRTGLWWLSSQMAERSGNSAVAGADGTVYPDGFPAGLAGVGIRPALTLNLSASSYYIYAGTVSSDGGIFEPEKKKQTVSCPVTSYSVPKGTKSFPLHASADGDGRITYSSSDSKAVSVSSGGNVKVKNYGKAEIRIHVSETLLYHAADTVVAIAVIPKQRELKRVKSVSSRKLYLSWETDKTVTGYQLQLSKTPDFSRETLQRSYKKRKSSASLTGLPSGKVYYIRIRPYRRVKKERLYGKWSRIRTVKIKK